MNGAEVVTHSVKQNFVYKDPLSFDSYKDVFGFEYLLGQGNRIQITITIPSVFVDHMYELAAVDQRKLMHLNGINRMDVPITFIKTHYQGLLSSHLKDFC